MKNRSKILDWAHKGGQNGDQPVVCGCSRPLWKGTDSGLPSIPLYDFIMFYLYQIYNILILYTVKIILRRIYGISGSKQW